MNGTQSLSWLNPNNIFTNSYLFGFLSLFLSVYGSRLHMKLPYQIQNILKHPLIKTLFIFLITYLSSKNIKSALTVTVIFLVLMTVINNTELFEKYENYGLPVSDCKNYSKSSINKLKTPYYLPYKTGDSSGHGNDEDREAIFNTYVN